MSGEAGKPGMNTRNSELQGSSLEDSVLNCDSPVLKKLLLDECMKERMN